jgi:hypothetical protein
MGEGVRGHNSANKQFLKEFRCFDGLPKPTLTNPAESAIGGKMFIYRQSRGKGRRISYSSKNRAIFVAI